MKHWNELTELETEIIRVGEFKNLFKLLVAGVENDTDMRVVQSAIYTLEGMIDDIDSTLYEKFQTVWDCVKDELPVVLTETENDYKFENGQSFDTMFSNITVTGSENQSSTYTVTSTEEDEAFKELEKAIKNWHKQTP
jgi:hypothetical protein